MKSVFFSVLFFMSDLVYACPACAGSMQNPRDKYLVYSLMIFIGLIYIPFYLLYRMIIKNRTLNERVLDNEK